MSRFGSCLVVLLLLAAPAFGQEVERSCSTCERKMKPTWRFCPFDGSRLPVVCPKCSRLMRGGWEFCPYDGATLKGKPSKEKTSGTESSDTFLESESESEEASGDSETAPREEPETVETSEGGSESEEASEESAPRPLNDPLQATETFLLALRARSRADLDPVANWERIWPEAFEQPTEERDALCKTILEEEGERLDRFDRRFRFDKRAIDNLRIDGREAEVSMRVPRKDGAKRGELRLTFSLQIEGRRWRVLAFHASGMD